MALFLYQFTHLMTQDLSNLFQMHFIVNHIQTCGDIVQLMTWIDEYDSESFMGVAPLGIQTQELTPVVDDQTVDLIISRSGRSVGNKELSFSDSRACLVY